MGDRIESVEVRIMSVPLPRPVAWANVKVEAREYVLVWIHSADGITGLGYTVGSRFDGGAKTIRSVITDGLLPLLIGKDPSEIERLWEDMSFHALLLGGRTGGAATRAISAVDIALWDLLGKRAGLPLCDLLGRYRSRVPAYASGGYYYHDDLQKDCDTLIEEVERHVELGFEAVKIKIGRIRADQDLVRVTKVLETVGPGIKVAVDANHAWRDSSSAIRELLPFDDLGLWWIEEPVLPDQMEASAAIAQRLRTPIATGEIEAGRSAFMRLMDMKAAGILQPDATVVGGISEWLKVAHTAASKGIGVAPHWVPEIHVHLGACTPGVLALEYFHSGVGVLNFQELLATTLVVEEGEVVVPSNPGHGIDLDGEAVERFEVHV